MFNPTMVKVNTCRPKAISFWLWSHYDTKMVDGFVILFYCNQFFCASKKMLVEGDVVFILDRRRKAPERSWTWSSAILERGSGVWVGRVEVQLPPFPEKKPTTTTATTQDNINNNNNKDQKNYQNSPLQLRRKIFLRSPASSCPKRKELERRRTKSYWHEYTKWALVIFSPPTV